jgi:hypothetical protein
MAGDQRPCHITVGGHCKYRYELERERSRLSRFRFRKNIDFLDGCLELDPRSILYKKLCSKDIEHVPMVLLLFRSGKRPRVGHGLTGSIASNQVFRVFCVMCVFFAEGPHTTLVKSATGLVLQYRGG